MRKESYEDVLEELRSIMTEVDDMHAKVKALDRIISRMHEIKWVAETYGLNDYAKQATEIIYDAVEKKKKLRSNIDKYNDAIKELKKKLNKLRR